MKAGEHPSHWLDLQIGEVADVIGGGTPKAGDVTNFAEPGSAIPWITPADLSGFNLKHISHGRRDLSQKGLETSSAKVMPKGTVLFSSRAPIGYVAVASNEIATNQGFKSFVFAEGVDPSFAYYYLRSIRELAESRGTGTTFKELSGAAAKKLPFVLPPLAEQKQIANKLDELLAQVDSIKTRLDAIPAILKRFRQSVLAAAVSGRLTEDWRGESSYQESDGLKLPTSWQIVTVGDIAQVKGGKRLPKGESLVPFNTGFPYIRAGQLKDGTVNPTEQLYLTPEVQESISRYIVEKGDVYITIVGACIGDAGVIPEDYHLANLTENAAKLCCLDNSVSSDFLSYWLRSEYLQELVQLEIKSGAQGKLALKRIKTLPFPMPSNDEQQEIVSRISQFISLGAQIEQRLTEAQTRINQLTQSILAKAFRGELTPDWREQHPELISGEHSAQALLDRIRAERENLAPVRRNRKKAASQ